MAAKETEIGFGEEEKRGTWRNLEGNWREKKGWCEFRERSGGGGRNRGRVGANKKERKKRTLGWENEARKTTGIRRRNQAKKKQEKLREKGELVGKQGGKKGGETAGSWKEQQRKKRLEKNLERKRV